MNKNTSKTSSSTESQMTTAGLLTMKAANEWIEESAKTPDPRMYFHDLIVEYENTVLFAASNVGKSILAVQIAEDIAKAENVLYVDLELSAKQFQMRYYDYEAGKAHVFPRRFIRAEIDTDLMMGANLEQEIIGSIEAAAMKGTKFFVIDNITFLCNGAESGIKAGNFMKQLVRLKKKYGLTTIVIAHTPKRRNWKPITQNDLAGSAKLINFFDAGIAIARSAIDCNVRYLKQVKVRTGEFKFDEENVLIMEVNKDHGFLKFDVLGCEREEVHLNALDAREVTSEMMELLMMYRKGMSIRQIAEEKCMSKSTVQRRLEHAKKSEYITNEVVPATPSVSGMGQSASKLNI